MGRAAPVPLRSLAPACLAGARAAGLPESCARVDPPAPPACGPRHLLLLWRFQAGNDPYFHSRRRLGYILELDA